MAAQLRDFDPLAHFEEKRLVLLDPVSQHALVAAREAVVLDGLQLQGDEAERAAVIIGTGIGGAHSHDRMTLRLYSEGNPRVHPMAIVRIMPDADGAARAMRSALAQAGMAADEVGCINGHGTGTPANDSTETRAIRAVYGAHADVLAVSSTKSMHGHALGASGAIELVAVIGALREGVLPPTINCVVPDPACDLNVVPNKAQQRPVHAALSNSFAFGGLNAVLVRRRAP